MDIYIVSDITYNDAVNKSLYMCPYAYVLSTAEVELHQRVHIFNILTDVN